MLQSPIPIHSELGYFCLLCKKKLPEKQIEFPLLCFRFRKQQKVTKFTMNALDLVTFNKTSEM